jgi:DNA-binding GntR family transcriptional regulator
MEPTDGNSEHISRGQLRQQVTLRILTGVFQGRFHSGERLVVQQLSERYQVSTTPVRESLLELANLGIVDLLPNRGAVVRPFGPREVREISQIRRVLEVEAARGACGRIADEELSALEQELTRLQGVSPSPTWAREARAADSALHGTIAAACDSLRLKSEIDRYVTIWRALRNISQQRVAGTNDANIAAVLAEHLAIVRALRARDAEDAARAMDRHIRSAGRMLEEALFAGPSPAETAPGPAAVPVPSRP